MELENFNDDSACSEIRKLKDLLAQRKLRSQESPDQSSNKYQIQIEDLRECQQMAGIVSDELKNQSSTLKTSIRKVRQLNGLLKTSGKFTDRMLDNIRRNKKQFKFYMIFVSILLMIIMIVKYLL